MENVIKEVDIELYSPTSYEIIHAQQGDNISRIIKFSLYNQGEKYTIPSNIIVEMEGHRGDLSSFSKKNCTISNNIITATLDNDILYAAGVAEAKIVMRNISDGCILSTIPFKIHVQKNPCNKNKIESEKRSLIDDLILRMEQLKARFETHIKDKIAHFSQNEHERFDKMSNETMVGYNENVPNNLLIGDYYLKEYK